MEVIAEVLDSPTLRRRRLPFDLPPDVPTDLDSIVRYRIASSTTLAESAECLLWMLSGGLAVWEDWKLLETRALVAALNRLKIIIHIREHPPAHFHRGSAGH